ncbi:MAG TPA: energy transducer TonB, partial [Hyphomonas sp.]|nr:energy transducer TonB [Hyphomonas sp.]HBU34812.1 energy transducer TonB [Hyphomonas sp.]
TPIGSLGPIITTASPVGDRTPVPVRPPLPAYPSAMAKRNVEGDCVVRFNLTARGLPFDVTAECTPSGFESEARRSVSRAEFLPQIIDGQAQESRGLTYPLEFRLNEE